MAYFVGYGYSDGFSVNMTQLLRELGPNSLVRLTVGTDAVCGPCPNNRSGLCDKPELVEGFDRAVLTLCGLNEGQVLRFAEFTSLVQTKVLAPGLRTGICGGCQWDGICASHASRWERDNFS